MQLTSNGLPAGGLPETDKQPGLTHPVIIMNKYAYSPDIGNLL